MIPNVKINGIKSIVKALDDLPKEYKKSGERSALRAGVKPIVKTARTNALKSKKTGLLIKSIGTTVRKLKTGELTGRVGIRSGFKGKSLGFKIVKKGKNKGQSRESFADPRHYAHLVEYGTSRTAAKPFMRKAVESNQGNALNEMAKALEKSIMKTAARMAKKR